MFSVRLGITMAAAYGFGAVVAFYMFYNEGTAVLAGKEPGFPAPVDYLIGAIGGALLCVGTLVATLCEWLSERKQNRAACP